MNESMSGQKKWKPEDSGPYGKMVVEMACGRELIRQYLTGRVHPSHPETRICGEPIFPKIKAVFDKDCASISVISHAIAANPRIAEGHRQDKNQDEELFEFIESEQVLQVPRNFTQSPCRSN
jgi:hypothetical protein